MNEKDLVGVTLGNCKIERIIGKGGMGAVYLAQQARPMRTVAIKVLIPATGYDADEQRIFLERFRREADTVAKLEHKNILPIYEYEEAEVNGQRLAYLVMPYIRGGTLRERIDEMRRDGTYFNLNTVASFIDQIADALSYAHSLGIIHRDIKPGNLLFHSDGRLLLSDFGIVRLSAMPSLTIAGSFIGTAEYASPEQVSAGNIDSRSDIYSLGIILYELLTNRVPFTGSTPFAVMGKQLNDPVPPVRAIRPDLSPAVEFVVKKALAKNPKDRYQHAGELAADFRAAVKPALSSPAGLRLSGDASNTDPTVADGSWQPPAPRGAAAPVASAVGAAPAQAPQSPPTPTQPAQPETSLPQGGPGAGAWQPTSGPQGWQRPAQAQAGLQQATAPSGSADAGGKTYRKGLRLYLYSVTAVALLLQFLILGLLYGASANGAAGPVVVPEVLAVLAGTAINLLAVSAMVFTGVARQRSLRTTLSRSLGVTILAPFISGFFIAFGSPDRTSGVHLPIVAYILLLLSNIYIVRQLSIVDAPNEQVEVVPVQWRSALAGALTGLLPLIIILLFALSNPPSLSTNTTPLLMRLLIVFSIVFIGAPTPGAMMAVWLTHKMSFPALLRSSGMAGMFMFLAAYAVVILWNLLIVNPTLFYRNFSQQEQVIAMLVCFFLLGLIGLLKGMLDAWVYYRFILKKI